jgi:alpha-ketoglutarate-dependent taurine dioxygenase
MLVPTEYYTPVTQLSDDDIATMANIVQRNGVVIAHDQVFDQQSYIDFMKQFGECETPDLFMNPVDFPEIFLVTGKLADDGSKLGMFGDTELGWHSNGNSRHNIDKILISLFCVQEDINTTLSVCSTTRPFNDLTDDEKAYWRTITIRIKFQNNTMYHLEEGDPELAFMSQHKGSIRKLVDIHPITGEEYFYFPHHFIVKAWSNKKPIAHDDMLVKLRQIIFQSKYQFHHIFKKGDILLMDQFTTLHRRSPVHDRDRLLWRIACDYQHVKVA